MDRTLEKEDLCVPLHQDLTLSDITGFELTKKTKSSEPNYQLSFVQLDDPLLEQIKDDILNTDINTLTPVEALMKLNEIKKLLGRKNK